MNKKITIKSISSAVIDGNTNYYIVDTDENMYYSSIKTSKNLLPFLKSGDSISISYNEGSVSQIIKIERSGN